jgi:hypothetical protein
VRKAVDSMRKKDIFERVLGREMRRQGLDYDAYIRVIGDIRERARKDKVSLVVAAGTLLSKQD